MGLLVEGVWRDQWYDTKASGGKFERDTSKFRNWVTADGAPGPSGEGGFKAESGRYHLYVSYACPWAHRTLIFRALKGLADHVDVSVVHPVMRDDGWTFDDGFPGATGDRLMGKRFLREVYLAAKPDATGRVTVPVLWDRERATIVSNESSEIIRMFNTAFDAVTGNDADYAPADLLETIDAVNAEVYSDVNNGVYKAGFATKQEAYDEAAAALFARLDVLEARLGAQRYLCGDRLTEADWRLFPTLVRFDPVYVGHFKCNIRRLVDYPNLWGWTRELYQYPGISETVRVDHFKTHYYASHATINPTAIVPLGPQIDFTAPHGRDRLKAA